MPETTESPWDRDAALKLMNGDGELLHDIMRIFLADCPGMLARLRQAVRDHDPERVAATAHKMIGSLGCLAMHRASQQARTLEDLGRCGALDAAGEVAARFEAELNAAMDSMTKEMHP